MLKRIYLSPPHLGSREQAYVAETFLSNWIAPVGPQVDAFEQEFAARIGTQHAVAVSSGTAALHLALRILGLKRGETVLCSTLTFAASANPIVYEGGSPVFIDSDPASWNMDPALLGEELQRCSRRGTVPHAVIVVLSNVLAAIGRGQLEVLHERVAMDRVMQQAGWLSWQRCRIQDHCATATAS